MPGSRSVAALAVLAVGAGCAVLHQRSSQPDDMRLACEVVRSMTTPAYLTENHNYSISGGMASLESTMTAFASDSHLHGLATEIDTWARAAAQRADLAIASGLDLILLREPDLFAQQRQIIHDCDVAGK